MTLSHNGSVTPVKTVSEAIAIIGGTKAIFAIDYSANGEAFITLKDGSIAYVKPA